MISKDYLDRFIYYDSTSRTGIRWKIDIWVGKNRNRKAISIGDEAGCYNKVTGYYQVRIERRTYRIHRLIPVLLGNQVEDGKVVDHKSGNKTENVSENLRVVDLETNAKNRISRKSNVGIPYIHYNEKLNRYQVALVLSGKRYTKTFPTLQHENALQSAVEYLLGKEEEMLKSGYTERQLNNIKKGINDSFSKSN